MHKLAFFVPESHLDSVKIALFGQGAGKIGDYDACCWQVLGQGQFRPAEGSQPFIGTLNEMQMMSEWKVEMVCEDHLIKEIVKTLKAEHPYEEVAYSVVKLEDF